MRRINSEFKTVNMSEEGQLISNRDYFGYVEMDDFACYVLADSLDAEPSANSAQLVVESVIRSFTERPSMGGAALKSYLREAHRELAKQHGGMRLKASAVMAVTDYKRIRYGYAGNSRFYLIRNARILFRTEDQSLTRNLLEEERLSLDQAAAHEARNNLYSFLGERGTPEIETSKPLKLENGDIFALLTRGVWEHCSDRELLDFTNDVKEPQELLNQVEDLILKNQESSSIDNYTLAVTFVKKVYQPPRKKWTVKKILMILLPVLLAVGGIGLALYLRHRSIRNKKDSLAQYMQSGETYMRYDNYQKASGEYGEALKLAKSLKRQEDYQEADQYKKLAEQIGLADDAMKAEDYKKAQTLYLSARKLSMDEGNVGKSYIDSQLEQTKGYIDVFDLIELADQKEADGDTQGAIEQYKEAAKKSAAIYYAAGKEEALQKQAAAEEKAEKDQLKDNSKQKEKEESAQAEVAKQQQDEEAKQDLENKQKANDQQNAIELENKGNEMVADGKYESAITFYQTAQAIYVRLELPDLADGINGKIAAAKAGIKAVMESQAAGEGDGAKSQEADGAGSRTESGGAGKEEKESKEAAKGQETTAAKSAEYGPGAGVQNRKSEG